MDLRQPDLRPLIAGAVIALAAPAAAAPPLPRGVGVMTVTELSAATRTPSGARLRWANSCVFLRPELAGTSDLPGDTEWTLALAGATAAWEAAAGGCGYLRFVLEPADTGEVMYDRVNRIIVRDDRWCRPGPPEKCYDSSALAVTTLFYVDEAGNPDDGIILDGDIELNAVDYALGICDGTPGGCMTMGTGLVTDLQNVLTHELGHLLGLSHTCASGSPDDAFDDDGNPLPMCNDPTLPAAAREATMYNFSNPEEIEKRTPETDDVHWFCARYPTASDPGVCEPVPPEPAAPDAAPGPDPGGGDGGGCGCRSGSPVGCVVVGLAALIAMRRRRRGAIATPR